MSHDPVVRERRQVITGLSIAGGMAFGGAISRGLKWVGYSPTTDIDVRHINLNQKHIMMVVEQLNKTQTYANKIMDESHTLERKEYITESYIQMETAIQGIMDSYATLMQGLTVLFHAKEISPLIVGQKELLSEIQLLKGDIVEREEVLLIRPQDVWHAPVSFFVTNTLDVWIMVHLPMGKSKSKRDLFEYVQTPMAFTANTTHFLAHPREVYVTVGGNMIDPRPLTNEEFSACKEIEFKSPRQYYCPDRGFTVSSTPPSCASSLYESNTKEVIKRCPITVLDEEFVHVSSLGFGRYNVYTRDPVLVRVLCGPNTSHRCHQ